MRRDGLFRKTAKQLLDDSIRAGRSLTGRHDGALLAYERLLRQVQSKTPLLRVSERPRDNRTALNAGLLALALHHADWLRPVETWFPTTQQLWPQFTALAHHLFARYPTPTFMTSVWFELLTSRALFLEGRAMRHCVATFIERCAHGQTSIWSMQVENQRGRHRVSTIEIDPTKRRICEARGKCNRLPTTAERKVVERWAAQEGLMVAVATRS